jgi:hypothetical protein
MTTHILKTWPEPFEAAWRGDKTFEIRVNDRDFQVGDELQLTEWNNATGEYTGRAITAVVRYIVYGGEWGLPENLCVMAFQKRAQGDYR